MFKQMCCSSGIFIWMIHNKNAVYNLFSRIKKMKLVITLWLQWEIREKWSLLSFQKYFGCVGHGKLLIMVDEYFYAGATSMRFI